MGKQDVCEDRSQFIASLAEEHKASHERFKQMVAVAFDEEGIEKLQSKLHELGFGETNARVIYTNEDILAWELSTDKLTA